MTKSATPAWPKCRWLKGRPRWALVRPRQVSDHRERGLAAAYLIVLIGLLFVQGMRIIVQDGVDHRKAIVVGVSFWLAAGALTGSK